MTASEYFQAGNLVAAIDAQIQKVKSQPADQAARLFLFELFLFSGDVGRARKQLDVLRYDRPEAQAAVLAYQKALDAEATRRSVQAGQARPKFLKDVPSNAELRLDALSKYSAGAIAEGNALLDRANSETNNLTATLNGESVTGLRDADDLFGPMIEVFAGAEYCWVPLDQIESLNMNPVSHPRDVVWRPANLSMRDGPQGDVLVPGLYPDSHQNADEAIRLGRATDWVGNDDSPVRGVGGKLLAAGEKWYQLNDCRQIVVTI